MERLLRRAEEIRFHKSIEKGNIKEVENFLKKYPEENYVYHKHQSAAATALKAEKFDIYELLISSGKLLGPHEDILKLLNVYDDAHDRSVDGEPSVKRKKVRDIHLKYIKIPSSKHIEMLRSKCRLSPMSLNKDRRKCNEAILRTLEDLNSIQMIEPMLKLVAQSENLQIIFDFDHQSVEHMNPTKDKNVRGLTTILKNRPCLIYVGALDLDTDKCYEAYGTLAHEICHYAMRVLYDNECKPYYKNDHKNQKIFSSVVDYCEKEKSFDEIVELAFGERYSDNSRQAELIVRVPHLLAFYMTNDAKLLGCVERFNQLFEYFIDHVLIDMTNQCPLMEIKRELKDLNDLCGVLCSLEQPELALTNNDVMELDLELDASGENINVISDCIQLTMFAIYATLIIKDDFYTSYVFTKISDFEIEKIIELIKSAYFKSNSTIIVDCAGTRKDKVIKTINKLKDLQMTARLIFVSNERLNFSEEHELSVEHSWSQLTEDSQARLMANKLKIQGKEVELQQIFSENSDGLNFLPLKDLIEDKMAIGSEIKKNESYFERKYLRKNGIEHEINPYQILLDDEIFASNFDHGNVLSFDNIFEVVDQEKVFLLTDMPGMGKTTEFKALEYKLKEEYPTHWVIFWDLKDFVNFYDKDGQPSSMISVQIACNFLSQKILKLKNFQAKVFEEFFYKNQIVLLLDGLDEISPTYKEFILKFVKIVKESSSNQIWISTRPHLVKYIQDFLTLKDVYRLKPLESEDTEEFLTKLLHCKGDHSQEKIDAIYKFFSRLEAFHNNFQWNPYLLYMAVEIAVDLNDVQIGIENPNPYSMYKAFVNMLILRFMKKGPVADDDQLSYMNSKFNITTFHQKQACRINSLVEGLRNRDSILSHTRLYKEQLEPWFDPSLKLSSEQTARIGLMYCNDFDSRYTFVHRTIAEFFVADFIFKTLFVKDENYRLTEKDLLSILDFFFMLLIEEFYDYRLIVKFLENAVESNTNEFKYNLDKVREIQKTLIIIYEQTNYFRLLYILARISCSNLFRIFSLSLLNLEKMDELWMGEDKTELGQNKYYMILAQIVSFSSLSFVEETWPFLIDFFGDDKMREAFSINGDRQGLMYLACTINNDQEVIRFLKEKVEILLEGEAPVPTLIDNELARTIETMNLLRISKTNF